MAQNISTNLFCVLLASYASNQMNITYNQYPMSNYWGTDARTDAWTHGQTDGRRFLNELRLRALAPGGARICWTDIHIRKCS